MSWDYLVPKYYGSPWEDRSGNSAYVTDLEWPRIGIYCPHDPLPWLFGSFSLSAEVLRQTDEPYWGWDREFATGDAHLIKMGRQSGDNAFQSLVGNDVHDDDQANDALNRAIEEHGFGSAQAAEALEKANTARENLRSRVVMRCGICSLSRAFRMEKVQKIVTVYWQIGRLEVPLEEFARRVDRAT